MDERTEYNKLHETWDNAHSGGSPTYLIRKRLLSWIIKNILKHKKNASVLDVGCGTGDYIATFSRYTHNYSGIDLSDTAINNLKKKYTHLNFKVNSVYSLKSKEKYDIIFLSEVLEHIDKEKEALRNIRKMLNEDGKLIISVPFDKKLWSYSDKIARHRRRYSKEYLIYITKSSGLEIDKLICYGFPFLRIYWELTRSLRNKINRSFSIKHEKDKKNFRLIYPIINSLFLLDLILLNTNKGVGLIAICSKGELK